MPKKRLVTMNVAAVAFGVLFLAVFGPGAVPSTDMLVLAGALIALSELWVVRFSLLRQRWTVSMSDAVVAIFLFHFPGAWIATAGTVGLFLSQLARRQRDPWKLATNSSVYFVAFAAAGTVAGQLPGPHVPIAAAVATVTFWLVNLSLMNLVVSWATGSPLSAVAAHSFPVSATHMTANVSLGVLAGWVSWVAPWALVGLFGPVAVVAACYELLTRKMDELRLLSEVINSQQRVRGGSIEDTALALLHAAAGVFGTQNVEMVVLDSDAPRRYQLQSGSPRLVEHGAQAAEAAWLAQLLGSNQVTSGETAEGTWVAMQVGVLPGPVIALRALGTSGRASGLTRREARLAQTLADHGSAWLATVPSSNAGPGSLASTVRSAANRLVTVAEQSPHDPPVADVLRELHRLERAVAVLLGEHPGPVTGPFTSEPRTAGAAGSWVSTGTIERPAVAPVPVIATLPLPHVGISR